LHQAECRNKSVTNPKWPWGSWLLDDVNLAVALGVRSKSRGQLRMLCREFQKRSQLFIRVHNKPLPVALMRVSNPDCSPFGINC
jgi:hypothetical protein